jgi:hypothetical protein
VGRFISKDPSPGYPSIPQSLNRYIYVGNNPINLVDPSGDDWISVGLGMTGLVAWVASAPTLGLAAVTASIWYNNYLFATGRISREEFIVKQVIAIPSLFYGSANLTSFGRGLRLPFLVLDIFDTLFPQKKGGI